MGWMSYRTVVEHVPRFAAVMVVRVRGRLHTRYGVGDSLVVRFLIFLFQHCNLF